jgi:Flp pilus assembly pilin Flp
LFTRQRKSLASHAAPGGETHKEIAMNKIVKKVRGASMVEYALLLVAVLLLAAVAYKNLGPKVGTAATNAGAQL